MSLVPMGGLKVSPNPTLVDTYPDVYLSNGLVAENHARESKISREAQDAFALDSHRKAVAAIDAGRFADEIVAVDAAIVDARPRSDARRPRRSGWTRDEGPRRDTSPEALAKLKPAFHATGSVTAGNSSQTSDGAAAVIVMSATRAAGARPDAARRVSSATPPPAWRPSCSASARCRRSARRWRGPVSRSTQIDLVELNEAFAAQILACLPSCRSIRRASTSTAARSPSATARLHRRAS